VWDLVKVLKEDSTRLDGISTKDATWGWKVFVPQDWGGISKDFEGF